MNKENNNIPDITENDFAKFVSQSVNDMHRELARQRDSLGARYNKNNDYEQLGRRFGEDPHRLIAEYNLILMKQSNQPASVRKPILHICNIALNRLIEEKRKEMEEKQEENNVKTK